MKELELEKNEAELVERSLKLAREKALEKDVHLAWKFNRVLGKINGEREKKGVIQTDQSQTDQSKISIDCNCGYEGRAEVKSRYENQNKVSAACPGCGIIHLVPACQNCGRKVAKGRSLCKPCRGSAEYNELVRIEGSFLF